MLRTQFVVIEQDGVWKIRYEGKHIGWYNTRRDALHAAINAAYDLAKGGKPYSPRVLAQSGHTSELRTEWTYGSDPYPPHL